MTTRPAKILWLSALMLVSVACMCGLGATPPAAEAPAPQETAAAEFESVPTEALNLSFTAVAPSPPQPAIPERRRLTLEFPHQIRAGDSDIVRLTLEVDDLGAITPTAVIGGNEVTGQTIEVPNLYETHRITAEARLDLAGVNVRPPDQISEPLNPGQAVTFFWSVQPPETGIYRGTVWLHLRFTDLATGVESRKALSAQTIELEAVDFFGLSANLARGTGAVGSVVGGILGLPFLSDILKALLRRRK